MKKISGLFLHRLFLKIFYKFPHNKGISIQNKADKQWIRKRQFQQIEKYLCLFVCLLFIYALFFNLLLLIRLFGLVILISLIVSIQELILIIREKNNKEQ